MTLEGVGIGLRPPHYAEVLEQKPALGFLEVVTENFLGLRARRGGGRPVEILEQARAHYPIALHGVSLNLGSTDPLDEEYLDRLAGLIARIQPAVVSDHLCWTGVRGQSLHDLMPMPATAESVRHLADRIARVQDRLGRRILIENVSSYVQFTHDELPEWELVRAVAERADCGILLDVNNVYVSAANHGFDPVEYLDGIPAERVGQLHIAGHMDAGSHLIDTHDHPVADAVWALYALTIARMGPKPALIEWDDKLPELSRLLREAASAATIQEVVLAESRDARGDGADLGRAAALDGLDRDRSAGCRGRAA